IARYDGDINGWGGFAVNDLFYVGDFNGDGKQDLYVFNGADWSMTYVGMLRSSGTGFTLVKRFDGDIPGWGGLARNDQLFDGDVPGWDGLARNDVFFPSDVNGDGKTDLFGFNCRDWSTEYLGKMISNGSSLSASYVADWIGEWNLGSVDQFETCNFEGVKGK